MDTARVPKRFAFTVDQNGAFTFKPDANWEYIEGDEVEFSTTAGPFTIDLKRENAPTDPKFNPLNAPLTATPKSDGTWVASTRVFSGMSLAERRAVYAANQPEGQDGFIATYKYVIDGKTKEGKEFHHATHNGIFVC